MHRQPGGLVQHHEAGALRKGGLQHGLVEFGAVAAVGFRDGAGDDQDNFPGRLFQRPHGRSEQDRQYRSEERLQANSHL